MKISVSLDWNGTYLEHKMFFDCMAKAMQKDGHRVGIVTGERERRKQEILNSLGFTPDFIYLWGEYTAIGNSNLWKCEIMDKENILVHFDDDAKEMKKFTPRWVIKVLNTGEVSKF